MKKSILKVISSLLIVTIVISMTVCAFAKNNEQPDVVYVNDYSDAVNALSVNEKKDYIPTIIVHGLGQSTVYVTDNNGNKVIDKDGEEITSWPIYPDLGKIYKLIIPVILTLIFQKDFASGVAYDVACDILKYCECKPDGTPANNVYVNRQYVPVSEMTKENRDEVYHSVPIENLGKITGEENLYYFAYNSLGDTTVLAKELNDYIEMVKTQRGCSQVNVVPISLGGTIASAWLEMFSGRYKEYKNNYASVHKFVFIVAAVDGSNIIGDIFTDQLLFDNKEFLYNKLLPTLMEDSWSSYAINIALRILPNDVLIKIVKSILNGAVDTMLLKTPSMWSLIPSAYFDTAYKMHMADKGSEYNVLKEKINLYHTAQINFKKNINDFITQGGIVHAICSYGLQLYTIGNSSLYVNSDTIIQSASTGFQSTFANLGETLGNKYTPVDPVCTNPLHNHISPDGMVDASTSIIPENTWFVDGLNHERTARCDSLINFAIVLLADDTVTDVHYNPSKYPQFNGSRVTRDLREKYIPDAEKVDVSKLTAEQAKELDFALKDCKAMLEETVVNTENSKMRMERLYNALVNCGVYQAEEPDKAEEILKPIFKFISELNKFIFGGKGFSEIFK